MSLEFGDDFGQKVDLCVRIREILRNYPLGTSVFKELLQNADDAGASEVKICLDGRTHPSTHLHGPMSEFQGPSLLVYNNAVFTSRDFSSIQRIGDSLKREESKGTKTGRFGIGFNSVFHLTDLPSFVSGDSVVFLDPSASHLPGVNPGDPGKRVQWNGAHAPLCAAYPDQFSPFKVWGCDPLGGVGAPSFPATLFRLPLRSAESASTGRLSQAHHSPSDIRSLLRRLCSEAHESLLFLKHVEKLSVWEWLPGASNGPTPMAAITMKNLSPIIRSLRGSVMCLAAGSEQASNGSIGGISGSSKAAVSGDSSSPSVAGFVRDFPLHMETRVASGKGGGKEGVYIDALGGALAEMVEAESAVLSSWFDDFEDGEGDFRGRGISARDTLWYICNQYGVPTTSITTTSSKESGEQQRISASVALAARPDLLHLRLVPWGGVAACLRDSRSSCGGYSALLPPLTTPTAYCFLPLPIHTHLPLHVNGYFDLSSNSFVLCVCVCVLESLFTQE